MDVPEVILVVGRKYVKYGPDKKWHRTTVQANVDQSRPPLSFYSAVDELLSDALDEVVRLRAVLATFTTHYECEDCWYSCPLADCCNDHEDTECDCGASRAIEALACANPLPPPKPGDAHIYVSTRGSRPHWHGRSATAVMECRSTMKEAEAWLLAGAENESW